ncbi:MAG: MnmC family methyltransferase [Bdellovibrionales bacterium]
MGLGLGYNEIISVASAVAHNKPLSELHSYESHPWLRENFLGWLNGQAMSLSSVYHRIVELAASEFRVRAREVFDSLKSMKEQKSFMLHESLPLEFNESKNYNVIYYDMFSGKMNLPYWEEDFFKHFLQFNAGTPCHFATYAATGKLKRALKGSGFQIVSKSGFSGKRQSTYAKKP